MRNWPKTEHFGDDISQEFGINHLVFIIAGGLYGGLHLLAWSAPFASSLSKLAWRVSAVFIASSGLLLSTGLVQEYVMKLIERIQAKYQNKLNPHILSAIGLLIVLILLLIFMAGFILYIPARVFLIVESFLQIARLPPAAYEVPNWSQYWSHFT